MESPPSIFPVRRSWKEWVDQHARVFFLYARQQTRCEADAKDVLQESLAEAWSKCPERHPDKAVVFATIRRRAVDLGRSLDRRQRREQVVVGESAEWFVPDFAEGDTRQCLNRAMMQLSPDLREVLVLRIWGDLSFPAIAQLTGVPCATATSRYRYALERLRGQLSELQP